jgi:hypothetical protein
MAASGRSFPNEDDRRDWALFNSLWGYLMIDVLTATLNPGSTMTEAARECYQLSQQIGIPINFVHNGRVYEVSLETKQIGGPPQDPTLSKVSPFA